MPTHLIALGGGGFAMEPDDVRRQLRLTGEGDEATVLLTRIGDRPVAIVAHPVGGAASDVR